MSTFYYREHKRQRIQLAKEPFAGGGEAELYQVIAPQGKNWAAKIYHPKKRTPARANKMAYLKQHSPYTLKNANTWIIDTLQDKKGNFVGILMPFQRGQKLEVLCGHKLPRSLAESWQVLALGQPFAREGRLRLGLQLAAEVARLHDSQHYILVDLKPDNVLVWAYRELALVDLDSVAVVEQGNVRFAASVATPEYAPPEYHQEHPALFPSWDNFSLAVMLYKLLFGIHPFAATAKAPYEQANNLGQKIEAGLFVHSPSKASFLTVVPPPHQHFYTLPKALQALFVQCFEAGHKHPEQRPKASAWCWALLESLGDTKLMATFREQLADGWERPRQPLLLPSSLLQVQQAQKEQWGVSIQPSLLPSTVIYNKAQVLLKKIEAARTTWKTPSNLFLGIAVWLLLMTLTVSDYNPAVIAWILFLLGAIVINRGLDFRQKKRKEELKQLLKGYKNANAKADVEGAALAQTWEIWKAKQEPLVASQLAKIQGVIQEKDPLVEQLIQARALAYRQVGAAYQEKLIPLKLPETWLSRPLAGILNLLQRRQKEQEKAVANALGNAEEQAQHQAALDKAKEQLQALEQQLLDEARVLFDWEAFFDEAATGLPWQSEQWLALMKEQEVPNLLAIEQLDWTEEGHLKIWTLTHTFVLDKAAYVQLELLYETYRLYEEPLAFARQEQLNLAPDFLRARFSALQARYQNELKNLQQRHQERQQNIQVPHQQALVFTKWQVEQLEELIEERQLALSQVEEEYLQQYLPIQEEVAQLLQQRLAILTQFNKSSMVHWEQLQEENYLIEVHQLLKKQARAIKQLL